MQIIPKKPKNNYVHLDVYNHKVEVEINNSRPNVFSIGFGGYLSIDDTDDLTRKIKRFRLAIKNKTSEIIPQLFSIENNKYIVVFDFSEDQFLIPNGKPYFSIDITLFCSEIIKIKEQDVIDKIQVMCELILELMYDNQDFLIFHTRKKTNLLKIGFD